MPQSVLDATAVLSGLLRVARNVPALLGTSLRRFACPSADLAAPFPRWKPLDCVVPVLVEILYSSEHNCYRAPQRPQSVLGATAVLVGLLRVCRNVSASLHSRPSLVRHTVPTLEALFRSPDCVILVEILY